MQFDEATNELIDADGSRWKRLNIDQDGIITDDAGRRYGRFDWVDEGRLDGGEPPLTAEPEYEGRLQMAGNRKIGKIYALLRSLQA